MTIIEELATMTQDQWDTLKRLAGCSMLPGSWDKRFVRNLAPMPIEHALTAKQGEEIERLSHRYRRQLGLKHGD